MHCRQGSFIVMFHLFVHSRDSEGVVRHRANHARDVGAMPCHVRHCAAGKRDESCIRARIYEMARTIQLTYIYMVISKKRNNMRCQSMRHTARGMGPYHLRCRRQS